MDKLLDTVKAIMEQGGPLAEKAMYYWFIARGFDALSNVMIAFSGFATIYLVARMIVNAVREYNEGNR